MKKTVTVLVLAFSMLLSLAGCGGGSTTNSATNSIRTNNVEASSSQSERTSTQKTQNAEKEKYQEPPSEVTQENLSSFPMTDEAMFTTEPVDGGVSITSCSDEDSTVIVVPETIGGETVVGVSKAAFYEMTMEGVVLPDTVTEIGMGAFQACGKLKYIELGSGLEKIGSMAFGDCVSLERIEFPEGMTTFSGLPLYNCVALTEVVVPDTVTDISVGIVSPDKCPNAVVVTPAGSVAEQHCIEYSVPYQNS